MSLCVQQIEFHSFNKEDDDFQGVDYSLRGKLSAVRIVFLYRFIQEVRISVQSFDVKQQNNNNNKKGKIKIYIYISFDVKLWRMKWKGRNNRGKSFCVHGKVFVWGDSEVVKFEVCGLYLVFGSEFRGSEDWF